MKEKNESEAPKYSDLIWPTIKALKQLGGSATNDELVEKIIEQEKYSEELQNQMSADGRRTLIEYRSAWARTYLKKFGAVDNSSRGVWVLLDKGEGLSKKDADKIPKQVKNQNTVKKLSTEIDLDSDDENENWKKILLDKIRDIDPSAFERLSQLVLRESGFTKVQVTGKSGDGGIDGVGILRVNLLSFHVSFQCKRYKGSVSSGDIRDFRGAMIGRGDKGLFITTGTFTSEARKEANRDGAPAIDLIDGDDFCILLKSLNIGVETKLIEDVVIDKTWFDKI